MIGTDLTSIPESEAIVILKAVHTHGSFMDEVEILSRDFISNEAAWAWEAMRRMMNEGMPIDLATLTIAEPRCSDYVWGNAEAPLYAAHFHAGLIHDAAIRRRVIEASMSMANNAKTMPISDLIDTSRAAIDSAAGLQKAPLVFVGDIADEVIADAQRARLVYPTPWVGLSEILGGGFRPGALYVVAARPGLGKTAIALQMASYLATQGLVAFSSLEMPDSELVRRLIAQGTGLPHMLLERGQELPPYAEGRIEEWKSRGPMSIAIDDRSSVNISDIRAFARSVSRSGHLSAIVVDYLQLISGPSGANRVEIVTEITRQLKIMAREMECPVIALSQLNRNSEGRMDKRPLLADLRESGSIEQDADVVMMLYRDPSWDDEGDRGGPAGVPLELNVAKNRHGPTPVHTLTWHGAFMRAD